MASPLFSKSARPTPNCECVSCGISFHTANPEQDACPRCLLTPKQRDINHRLLSAPKRHTLLYGGARSGKTVLFVRAIMMRAIHAPETRHAMLRLRANAARASLWLDTLPKVQRVFFPKFTLRDHRQDGYVEIVESGSQIWIAGTDDKERIEKILGQEFLTIYLNECSQIPYSTVLTVLTRLAQTHPEVMQKAFYDLNPVGTRHYTSMLFRARPGSADADPDPRCPPAAICVHQPQGQSHVPDRGVPAVAAGDARPAAPAVLRMASTRLKSTARCGPSNGQHARCLPEDVPRDLKRVVVAIDPSGTAGDEDKRSDNVGIIVAGKSMDNIGYVLADRTCNLPPEGWARVAVTAYREFKADRIVAEQRDINHRLLSAPKRHTLLYGGARSGKTVLFVRAIMMRAIPSD